MSSEFGCLGARICYSKSQTHYRGRYLCLDESIPLTRQQHRQYDEAPLGSQSVKFYPVSLCPRLIMLAVVKDIEKPQQLQITLYRRIVLATFLDMCRNWTSASGSDIVSVLGHSFSMATKKKQPEGTSIEISHLIIKPGAVIQWPMVIGDIAPWRPVPCQQRYLGHVHIKNGADQAKLKETLKTIFDHPNGARPSNIDNSDQDHLPRISLECSPSVLALVTESVSCIFMASLTRSFCP